MVRCVQRQGEAPKITVPEGLVWELQPRFVENQGKVGSVETLFS